MNVVLSGLYLYPVKSLGGIRVERWRLDAFGLHLDRRWMVVDGDGRFLTQRQHPQMARVQPELGEEGGLWLCHPDLERFPVPQADPHAPRKMVTVWNDRVEAVPVGKPADRWLSRAIGVDCQLVWFPDDALRAVDPDYAGNGARTAFSDGFPLLLVSQASLDDLNRRLEAPLPVGRFRPNLVVSGTAPYAEDGWRHIAVGGIPMEVVKPCSRCSITTVDPETGRRTGPEPLATLATYRRRGDRVYFGQNVVHRGLGELAVGMGITLEN